ncbi:uncharacterized protein LOC127786924 isoform X2 [Diospyros lotus]|uniref:uncharacterized protein LOC127786924 isoform X2 n=1 Tax=Diospyros lotus TaxID=55363 RepID=UPI00224D1B4C|nr:uncharacterized protein LOC127786924 isoform X2 [Diospyros lotus]
MKRIKQDVYGVSLASLTSAKGDQLGGFFQIEGAQAGARYAGSALHMMISPDENSQENCDGEERDGNATKTSVKTLMEEEMLNEQGQKQQMGSANSEINGADSECRGHGKKHRKRTRRTNKGYCDIHFELDAAENLGPQNSYHQGSEEKSSKNLDLELKERELYEQIYQKSTSCLKHDLNNDLDMQSEQTYAVFDKGLSEAIKVFVDQTFKDGKHVTDDGKSDHPKEFIDALQTLSSNKELILELLNDPQSLLVKHLEDLELAQAEKNRTSNPLAGSNLLDGELNNSKPTVPVAPKRHNFFRRRTTKSQEKVLLNGDENFQTSSRIVILKPGPAAVKISDAERTHGSSLRSNHSSGSKVETEKNPSQFSFTEIKRKLKHAMGKERHVVPSDDLSYRFPYERRNSGNSDKGIGGEKGGWNSPNRDHFYMERFARPANGSKNKEKNSKPRHIETSKGNGTVDCTEQRVSNTYIEAKKHLSEMLSNGDDIELFSGRQLPKTLGRMISLPQFNLSPGRDKEHSFITARQRMSPYNPCHVVNEDKLQIAPESRFSHLGPSQQNSNSQSCINDNPEHKGESCNSSSDGLDELHHPNYPEDKGEPFNSNSTSLDEFNNSNVHPCSMKPEKSSEDDVAKVQTTDAVVKEESTQPEISADQSSSSVVKDNQRDDLPEVCTKEESVHCLKMDSFEEDPLPSSPLASPPSSSVTKHVGDVDSPNERPDRPSPVSVLEPSFTEDDISPAGIKSRHVEPPMQPQQIHFEEQLSPAANHELCVRACIEDEESAFQYVEVVLLASDLNWEEFLLRWLSSNQILDPSLFDEVELFSNRSSHDQKLLFDCTNEVLKEVCEHHFGYTPWKPNIRPIPRGKDLIQEIWEGVEWHLASQPSSQTLDHIVRKDMTERETWMDLRFDVQSIGTGMEEAIFEELVEDTIWCFKTYGPADMD